MNFLEHFQSLDDPRSHINRKHDLLNILFLTISAILSGSEGWDGIEAFRHLKLDWLKKYRVIALKGNQGNLEKEVKAWRHKLERDDFKGSSQQRFEQIEKGHGRIEERYTRQIKINDGLSEAEDWKDFTTLIEMKRIRHHKNKTK